MANVSTKVVSEPVYEVTIILSSREKELFEKFIGESHVEDFSLSPEDRIKLFGVTRALFVALQNA